MKTLRVDMRITPETKKVWLHVANRKKITLTRLIERAMKRFLAEEAANGGV